MTIRSNKNIYSVIYRQLYKHFGPQHWWPGDTPFEIIVGAILTQNTNWGNVEKAIENLKKENVLSAQKFLEIPESRLAHLIKPAGYFNVKAKRLKNFIKFLFEEFEGNLSKMSKVPTDQLRTMLLSVNGIGPETADSILLYAFDKPVFVIDAYTKRFLYRHNLVEKDSDYQHIQDVFMGRIRKNISLYNEYHALIVALGKHFCKTKPMCEVCPLKDINYSIHSRCQNCFRFEGARTNKIKKVKTMCLECRKEGG